MMSNEELVLSYQSGNKEALEILWKKNEGMVVMISTRFGDAGTLDDRLQEAFLALRNAARLWDSQRGIRFSTYLWRALVSRLVDWRRHQRLVYVPENRTPTGEYQTLSENNVLVCGYICDPSEILAQQEEEELALKKLQKVLNILPYRERLVLVERSNGRTFQEIGDQFHLSRERVRQLEMRALKKLSGFHPKKKAARSLTGALRKKRDL